MSGGYFDYKDFALKNQIFDFHGKDRKTALGDREISELTWDLLDLIHEYDWYASGDTSEEEYLQAKKVFKAKWLSSHDERHKRMIDEAVEELRTELYKTFEEEADDD